MEKEIKRVKPTENLYKFLPIDSEEVEFSPNEIPKKYRPTFKIKQFSQRDKAKFSKVRMAVISLSQKMAEQVYEMNKDFKSIDEAIDSLDVVDHLEQSGAKVGEILRKYILGWSNFPSIGGKEFKYENDEDGLLKQEIYDKIPAEMINLITNKILEISGLSEEEKVGLKS